jgi:DNA-binding transcriptional MerR regulator
MRKHFTTAELAELCGVQVHHVQRLFSKGLVPEVERFAGRRMIPREMLPTIIDALRAAGWLEASAPVAEPMEAVPA